MKHLLIGILLAAAGSCYADDVTEKLNQLRAEKESQKTVFKENCEASNTQNVRNVVQARVKHQMNKDEFVKIYGGFKKNPFAADYDSFAMPLDSVWIEVTHQLRGLTIRLYPDVSVAQWRADALAKIDLIEAKSIKAVIDSCVSFHVRNTQQFAD